MDILFLTSSMEGGGAERVASILANAWADRGHQVTIMPTFSERGVCAYTLHPAVRLSYLADQLEAGAGRSRRVRALRRYVLRSKPTVVVSFLASVNVAAILATLGTKIPVVVSERTYPPLLDPALSGGVAIMRRLIYRLAKAVVVQTEDTAAWIRANCIGARVVTIRNPIVVPLASAEPMLSPSAICNDDRRLILSVGRLVKSKRTDKLFDAFGRIASRHPDWDLVVLGDGAERDALEAQVRAIGLSHRIHLPGFVGNPGIWYGRSDIYVTASAYEGFPNSLIEAMAYGLPAVAFDVKTGTSEILDRGRAGLLLPDDNHVERLERALEHLIRDPRPCQDCATRANNIRERFALDRVLQDWDEVLA